MIRMVTKMQHVYGGRDLAIGDEFDCEDNDAHLLTVLGRAEVIAPPAEMHNGALIAPNLIRAASQRAILKRKAP